MSRQTVATATSFASTVAHGVVIVCLLNACGTSEEGYEGWFLDGKASGRSMKLPTCEEIKSWCEGTEAKAFAEREGLSLSDCVVDMTDYLMCDQFLHSPPPIGPKFPQVQCDHVSEEFEGSSSDASCVNDTFVAEQEGSTLVLRHFCTSGTCPYSKMRVVSCADRVIEVYEGNDSGIYAMGSSCDLRTTIRNLPAGNYKINLFEFGLGKPASLKTSVSITMY